MPLADHQCQPTICKASSLNQTHISFGPMKLSNENPLDLADLYDDGYFEFRVGNDDKRLESFRLERRFIARNAKLEGACCDVGCSTGEFLQFLEWSGPMFGLEISSFAIKKAEEKGIKIIPDSKDAPDLDMVIFRGTIQHLDNPFKCIENLVQALKPDGKLFFLATPNAGSIYYRLFQDLPALDEPRNFYIPSYRSLKSVMKIYGFECVDEEFPYWQSPYSSPLLDMSKFSGKLLLACLNLDHRQIQVPFFGSMMNLCFSRK